MELVECYEVYSIPNQRCQQHAIGPQVSGEHRNVKQEIGSLCRASTFAPDPGLSHAEVSQLSACQQAGKFRLRSILPLVRVLAIGSPGTETKVLHGFGVVRHHSIHEGPIHGDIAGHESAQHRPVGVFLPGQSIIERDLVVVPGVAFQGCSAQSCSGWFSRSCFCSELSDACVHRGPPFVRAPHEHEDTQNSEYSDNGNDFKDCPFP